MTHERPKTAGQQLQDAQRQIEQAERLAGLGFWEWDIVEDRLTYCSEGYARMLDMTREEVVVACSSSELDSHFLHPDDRQRYIEADNQAHINGVGINIEYRVITAKNQVRHLREISEVVKNESGEIVRTSGIVQDITDAKLAEEELARTLADAHRAEHMAKLGTYSWTWPEGRIEACSEEFARLLERTVEQVLETFTDPEADYATVHPDEREAYAAIETEALAKGEGYTAEYRLLLPSGGMRHIREVCEVELNDRGEVIRSTGSIQDISEQVNLQDQLRQAVKMEALGQLTGGVAHDFNNMLTVIMGNVDLVINMLGIENSNTKLLMDALEAAKRGATLTQRLLAFSRKQSLQVQTIDLQGLVLGMKDLLQRTLGATIQVEIQETGHPWLAETDATQLESAILNLAINARDAMPEGGSLRIELDSIVLDEDHAYGYENLNAGSYIRLSVSDTGTGMSQEIQALAFDPFFTTKDVGEGTGLGLSMVYGFLKQCRGHVSIYSESGKGTVVKLYLPVSPAGAIEPPLERSDDDTRNKGEQVLVVEDDAEVRKLAVRLLKNLGYRTVEAKNASEA
ncbi:MAG: PAS domain-containing protein, partial [Gammaproteobacteria bacterium]|nr:PAS domain-containing protein [Gammaproteobacteria bacterium]